MHAAGMTRILDVDEDFRRRALKTRDSWWAVLVIDPLALPVLAVLVRLPWVTPIRLTMVGVAFGVAAVGSFGTGHLVLGAILFELRFFADCLDGKLARVQRLTSPQGAFLDLTMDVVLISCAMAALGWHLSRSPSADAAGPACRLHRRLSDPLLAHSVRPRPSCRTASEAGTQGDTVRSVAAPSPSGASPGHHRGRNRSAFPGSPRGQCVAADGQFRRRRRVLPRGVGAPLRQAAPAYVATPGAPARRFPRHREPHDAEGRRPSLRASVSDRDQRRCSSNPTTGASTTSDAASRPPAYGFTSLGRRDHTQSAPDLVVAAAQRCRASTAGARPRSPAARPGPREPAAPDGTPRHNLCSSAARPPDRKPSCPSVRRKRCATT